MAVSCDNSGHRRSNCSEEQFVQFDARFAVPERLQAARGEQGSAYTHVRLCFPLDPIEGGQEPQSSSVYAFLPVTTIGRYTESRR